MSTLLELCREAPEISLAPGEPLVEEGSRTGFLYVLIDGEVTVQRGGIEVARLSDPGSAVGEMAILLDLPHLVTVTCHQPSRFHAIADGAGFLNANPEAIHHLARVLALRLQLLTSYLADLKRQFSDREDQAGLIDAVLEALFRQRQSDFASGSERQRQPNGRPRRQRRG